MTIFIDPGFGKPVTLGMIREKLTALANADKTKQWICKDLSTPNSSSCGRCFWHVFARHFQCTRNAYGIDLNATQMLLERLKTSIPDGTNLADLFDKAVGNFEKITNRRLNLPAKVFAETISAQPPVAAPAHPAVVVVEKPPVVVTETVVVNNPVPAAVFVEPAPIYVAPRPIYVPPVYVPPVYHRPPNPVFVAPAPTVYTSGPAPTVFTSGSAPTVYTSGPATSGYRQVPGTGSVSYRSAPSRPSYVSRSSPAISRPSSFGGGSRPPFIPGTRVIPGSRR